MAASFSCYLSSVESVVDRAMVDPRLGTFILVSQSYCDPLLTTLGTCSGGLYLHEKIVEQICEIRKEQFLNCYLSEYLDDYQVTRSPQTLASHLKQ